MKEGVERLQRCERNAPRTTFVASREIPKLFHPCVDKDKASPSARGDGRTCSRTFVDPVFGTPVVAQHFRIPTATTTGGPAPRTRRWTCALMTSWRPSSQTATVSCGSGGRSDRPRRGASSGRSGPRTGRGGGGPGRPAHSHRTERA
ncbi:hypothetical protein GCM10019016_103810 [Streptomyces prasinosporus]|uniref:Uncharacterized protein n=1 Tax=Streptomyces prasinosporus TaxID=68256 RepID=A0ABP6U6E3_9ACTN